MDSPTSTQPNAAFDHQRMQRVVERHRANVSDPCHGMTGGIKVSCSCGSWWVIPAERTEHGERYAVSESIAAHRLEIYRRTGVVTDEAHDG